MTQLLERHFAHLVDYGFTATMEEALDVDRARRGRSREVAALLLLRERHGRACASSSSDEHLAHDRHGRGQHDPDRHRRRRARELIVRVWPLRRRTSQRGDEKAPLPADLAPDELTRRARRGADRQAARAGPRRSAPIPRPGCRCSCSPAASVRSCSSASRTRARRRSRSGRRCSRRWTPTRSRSRRRSQLLSLPRVVGADAEGDEIIAQNGRYGPYLKKGTDSRSLESEDQLFTVTLAEAEAFFAQPKQRRGRQAKPPLAELGEHPDIGRAGPRARRSLRPVRHRRHHERDRAARHRPGVDHARARRSTCCASARAAGPADEEGDGAKKPAKKKTAKKAREEDARRRRPRRRRRRSARRRRRRKATTPTLEALRKP